MKFDKKFFEAEEREGFLVPELMKRAWAAEIEILEVIGELFWGPCGTRDLSPGMTILILP